MLHVSARWTDVTAGTFYFLLLIHLGEPASAECTSTKPATTWERGSIELRNESRIPERMIHAAISEWSVCDSYGKGFPSFVLADNKTTPTSPVVKIRYVASSTSQRCAYLRGNVITLYSFAKHSAGHRISCGDMSQNLAHELGHFLGLNHAAKTTACKFNIMATIKPRNARNRRVEPDECQAVDDRWLTRYEVERSLLLDKQRRADLESP